MAISSNFQNCPKSEYSAAQYKRRLCYDARIMSLFQNLPPPEIANRIICGDARSMTAVPDCSIGLALTSPPYNAGVDYDVHHDRQPERAHLDMLQQVFAECYRALVYGGRIAVVCANTGRSPYTPLAHRIADRLAAVGFALRGEIIWDKGAAGLTSAWGSWRAASAPTLRDCHEYIIVASKGLGAYPNAHGRKPTISAADYCAATQSVWRIPPASAKRVGHPAPFPVELPRRLIELYTYKGDAVLDPFIGSGTTALAAIQTGRAFVGYELSAAYAELARGRIAASRSVV